MFYEINEFEFLSLFTSNVEKIANEFFNSIDNSEITRNILNPNSINGMDYYTDWWSRDNGFHPDQTGVDVRNIAKHYQSLSIFKKKYPIKHFDVESNFPFLLTLLKRVPNLYFSTFLKSQPKHFILKHTHTRKHLIFHLLINDLEGGAYEITVNEETRSMAKKGDWLLFDYSQPHSARNTSQTSRYGLAIDFNPFE